MKKICTMVIIGAILMAACLNESANAQTSAGGGGSRILVAYFTMPETDGVDTVAGASRLAVNGQVLGNTQYVAQLIQRHTGGDMFVIRTVQTYPGAHQPLLDFARQERTANTRPALAASVENLDQYDTIFLGFPVWYADLPMPLYSFLEQTDFSGKTLIPFSTHGGSQFSSTINTIVRLQPNASVTRNGFTVSRNSAGRAERDVTRRLESLGFVQH
ncbi:flavodoxin [Brucepastera parasyntrophica]|uniref:flavodoxin n=1 Tax=Brucepastera parasyntrophica TaxID=2880008 RepID=UPI00210D7D86|nr:flavodoxin [Brucepastera parasyntrophica]ULQ58484.1 flavodoxin [Brucepastera parasyntrophica]